MSEINCYRCKNKMNKIPFKVALRTSVDEAGFLFFFLEAHVCENCGLVELYDPNFSTQSPDYDNVPQKHPTHEPSYKPMKEKLEELSKQINAENWS